MKSIQNMYDHLHWANLRIFNTLNELNEPNKQALNLFTHTLLAERVWVTRIARKNSVHLPIWSQLSLEECNEILQQNHHDFTAFFSRITDQEAEQNVVYQNSSRNEFHNTLKDILIHVALHGQYHRGQINLLLRQNGEEPIGTDYILFKRESN